MRIKRYHEAATAAADTQRAKVSIKTWPYGQTRQPTHLPFACRCKSCKSHLTQYGSWCILSSQLWFELRWRHHRNPPLTSWVGALVQMQKESSCLYRKLQSKCQLKKCSHQSVSSLYIAGRFFQCRAKIADFYSCIVTLLRLIQVWSHWWSTVQPALKIF